MNYWDVGKGGEHNRWQHGRLRVPLPGEAGYPGRVTLTTRLPCYHGDGSPDPAPRACAGGRRGRRHDAPPGRSSRVRRFLSPPVSEVRASDWRRRRQRAGSCGLGNSPGETGGHSYLVSNERTRGQGVETPGCLAESVLVSAVFRRWRRRRRPLPSGLRAPLCAQQGLGWRCARLVCSDCPRACGCRGLAGAGDGDRVGDRALSPGPGRRRQPPPQLWTFSFWFVWTLFVPLG